MIFIVKNKTKTQKWLSPFCCPGRGLAPFPELRIREMEHKLSYLSISYLFKFVTELKVLDTETYMNNRHFNLCLINNWTHMFSLLNHCSNGLCSVCASAVRLCIHNLSRAPKWLDPAVVECVDLMNVWWEKQMLFNEIENAQQTIWNQNPLRIANSASQVLAL